MAHHTSPKVPASMATNIKPITSGRPAGRSSPQRSNLCYQTSSIPRTELPAPLIPVDSIPTEFLDSSSLKDHGRYTHTQTPSPPEIVETPSSPQPLHRNIATGSLAATLNQTTHHAPIPLRQTQHSTIAKSVMSAPAMTRSASAGGIPQHNGHLAPPRNGFYPGMGFHNLSDTPVTTAPNSPRIRATTLDIPGLTKSRISPDGRIAPTDIGSKLVIVMVGLPARGKSYVTRKIARYLNWAQHNTKIFNVGQRRRIAASGGEAGNIPSGEASPPPFNLSNGTGLLSPSTLSTLLEATKDKQESVASTMDQSSDFFDPNNVPAKIIREKVAMETLDELLHYILEEDGSVGILDATNSTIERRTAIVKRIREVAGNELGIVFLESECRDEKLLEGNMRLKLSGPDYKGMDPAKALEDFRRRVQIYERSYVSLGDYEEKMGWQYIKMVDVGRKVVCHQIRGFLAGQTVYYLLNFNLAPRQIWITRHGESTDNVQGRIGGDAPLSANGKKYAAALARFIEVQRKAFHVKLLEKHASSLLPPRAGDTTPPNPEYSIPGNDPYSAPVEKNFCVWTSMLQRSVQTAQFFDDEEYDVKEMRMLDELNAGVAEGMTYEEILARYPHEYHSRRKDKLHYRYPGAGGESYLDVINRLRTVILEVERMTDHVLLIGHRVVARVLLAYFLGLERDDVTDLDVPLGMLYVLEPKPYGVGFTAYQYNPDTDWFHELRDYKVKRQREQLHGQVNSS